MADNDLTALQLAEAIARRVLGEVDGHGIALGPHDSYFDGSLGGSVSVDVLAVLKEHGVWFCRLSETEQGTVMSTTAISRSAGR